MASSCQAAYWLYAFSKELHSKPTRLSLVNRLNTKVEAHNTPNCGLGHKASHVRHTQQRGILRKPTSMITVYAPVTLGMLAFLTTHAIRGESGSVCIKLRGHLRPHLVY